MSKYKELVYMCMDEIKLISDDTLFTEDHAIYLLNKYRAFLLQQKYAKGGTIPDSNYQTICLDLIQVPAIAGEHCECDTEYLRSKVKIPKLMNVGHTTVYPLDYYTGDIALVSRDRMKYVGYNKYLKDIIYASIGPDNYLYFKSCNPDYLNLKQVRMTGIFEAPEEVILVKCPDEVLQDTLEEEFPLEEVLVPQLIELVVKELLGATYRPSDNINNASDDLSNIHSFIRNNVKGDLQKQISS